MKKTFSFFSFLIVTSFFGNLHSRFLVSAADKTGTRFTINSNLVSPVVDLHSDVILWVEAGKIKFSERNSVGQTDLPRLAEGGVNVETFNLWADPQYMNRGTVWARTIYMIEIWKELLKQNQSKIEVATNIKELTSILSKGKIAVLGKLEGAHSLEGNLNRLSNLQKDGVSILQITWNNTNEFGDAAKGEQKYHGLSEMGLKLVKECNRRGMVIDLAHASEETTIAAAKASRDPIIVSHTAVKALKNHPRTVSDAVIRAIAANGGVIHISAVNDFLSETWGEGIKKFREHFANDLKRIDEQNTDWVTNAIVTNDFYEKNKFRDWAKQATTDKLIDHIEYIAKLVGVDYVGIGTDFDGWEAFNFPSDLKDYSMFGNLKAKLKERGFSKQDIDKIMGGNFLRVYSEVTK